MNNPFIYSDDNKRYHTFNYYLRHRYHKKVYKVPLDAHFTFCSGQGSGEYTRGDIDDIVQQFETNKIMMEKKWPNSLAMPYFQSFSNTYGPLA